MNLRSVATVCLLAAPSGAAAQSNRPAADSAWIRGDRAAAHSLYLECVETDEEDVVALFRLGLLAGWEGRSTESIEWFDRLLAIHPQDRDARVARARAVAATGDIDGAISAVDSILATHPREVSALIARGRFADWSRDRRTAERLWRHALDIDPANVEARAGLAGNLRRQGRLVEARREIAVARAAAPTDIDVRNGSDYIERLFRPAVRTNFTVEDDSDGNLMTTLSAGAGFRAGSRIAVRADGWMRDTQLESAALDVAARGVSVGLAVDAGWMVGASIGASESADRGTQRLDAFSVYVRTPPDRAAIISVTGSRTPLDYTLPMIRNGVVTTGVDGGLAVRSGRDWDIDFTAGVAKYDVTATGADSRRVIASARVRRRLNDAFAVVIGARGFGFDRDIDGGFFDPDSYGLVDTALMLHLESAHWLLDAEVAPGMQRVGSAGTASGAVRAVTALAWQLRPGRQIALRATFANTGFEQLGPEGGEAYRYAALGVSLAWWF